VWCTRRGVFHRFSLYLSSRFAEHGDSCLRAFTEVGKKMSDRLGLLTPGIFATPQSFFPRMLRYGLPKKDRKSTLFCLSSARGKKGCISPQRLLIDRSWMPQSEDCTARTRPSSLARSRRANDDWWMTPAQVVSTPSAGI
jgi:hypothetical protein